MILFVIPVAIFLTAAAISLGSLPWQGMVAFFVAFGFKKVDWFILTIIVTLLIGGLVQWSDYQAMKTRHQFYYSHRIAK